MEQKLNFLSDSPHILSSTSALTLNAWFRNLREFELDNMFDTHILGRGYECSKNIQETKRFDFLFQAKIKGSREYIIVLQLENSKIIGSCTCPHDRACKHLAGFLISRINCI